MAVSKIAAALLLHGAFADTYYCPSSMCLASVKEDGVTKMMCADTVDVGQICSGEGMPSRCSCDGGMISMGADGYYDPDSKFQGTWSTMYDNSAGTEPVMCHKDVVNGGVDPISGEKWCKCYTSTPDKDCEYEMATTVQESGYEVPKCFLGSVDVTIPAIFGDVSAGINSWLTESALTQWIDDGCGTQCSDLFVSVGKKATVSALSVNKTAADGNVAFAVYKTDFKVMLNGDAPAVSAQDFVTTIMAGDEDVTDGNLQASYEIWRNAFNIQQGEAVGGTSISSGAWTAASPDLEAYTTLFAALVDQAPLLLGDTPMFAFGDLDEFPAAKKCDLVRLDVVLKDDGKCKWEFEESKCELNMLAMPAAHGGLAKLVDYENEQFDCISKGTKTECTDDKCMWNVQKRVCQHKQEAMKDGLVQGIDTEQELMDKCTGLPASMAYGDCSMYGTEASCPVETCNWHPEAAAGLEDMENDRGFSWDKDKQMCVATARDQNRYPCQRSFAKEMCGAGATDLNDEDSGNTMFGTYSMKSAYCSIKPEAGEFATCIKGELRDLETVNRRCPGTLTDAAVAIFQEYEDFLTNSSTGTDKSAEIRDLRKACMTENYCADYADIMFMYSAGADRAAPCKEMIEEETCIGNDHCKWVEFTFIEGETKGTCLTKNDANPEYTMYTKFNNFGDQCPMTKMYNAVGMGGKTDDEFVDMLMIDRRKEEMCRRLEGAECKAPCVMKQRIHCDESANPTAGVADAYCVYEKELDMDLAALAGARVDEQMTAPMRAVIDSCSALESQSTCEAATLTDAEKAVVRDFGKPTPAPTPMPQEAGPVMATQISGSLSMTVTSKQTFCADTRALTAVAKTLASVASMPTEYVNATCATRRRLEESTLRRLTEAVELEYVITVPGGNNTGLAANVTSVTAAIGATTAAQFTTQISAAIVAEMGATDAAAFAVTVTAASATQSTETQVIRGADGSFAVDTNWVAPTAAPTARPAATAAGVASAANELFANVALALAAGSVAAASYA